MDSTQVEKSLSLKREKIHLNFFISFIKNFIEWRKGNRKYERESAYC